MVHNVGRTLRGTSWIFRRDNLKFLLKINSIMMIKKWSVRNLGVLLFFGKKNWGRTFCKLGRQFWLFRNKVKNHWRRGIKTNSTFYRLKEIQNSYYFICILFLYAWFLYLESQVIVFQQMKWILNTKYWLHSLVLSSHTILHVLITCSIHI